jgi:hypothetical protein
VIFPKDWRAGIKRVPLHLVTFGLAGFLLTWYGGWGAAIVLSAWRGYAEFLDWHYFRDDTFAKALIDLLSQTLPAILASVLRWS